MKNGDYVIAPVGCAEYLTAGNKYKIFDVKEIKDGFGFRIIDNEGDKLTCFLKDCGHINYQDWILATESEAFLKEVEEPKDLLKEVILLLDRAKELLNKI